MSYNTQNLVAEKVTQKWTGSWVNDKKQIYGYDGSNYLVNILNQSFGTGAWVISGQFNYTNNTDGRVSEQIEQTYLNNIWKNFSRTVYTYPLLATQQHRLAGFSVYPNPATSTLYIATRDGQAPASCYVTDMTGRIVMTAEHPTTVTVQGLSHGTYVLHLVTALHETTTYKFIKT